MRRSGTLLLCTAFAVVGVMVIHWPNRDMPITLPNNFVLSGDDLFTADQESTLATDIEFVCFDDRFVEVHSKVKGQGGLFDARTQTRVLPESHPEIFQPGGLKYGRRACNGYYTAVLGPRLLSGGPAPFLPSCTSVNRENPTLRDQSWLNRPCANR